jgi:deoxyadenosine/deoxycytidine kinase
MEQKIDPNYFARINGSYEEFFAKYTGPKIRIPMDEWDFLQHPELYGRLSQQIDERLKSQ